jgi:GNAT superfamily N-acetyltransferase
MNQSDIRIRNASLGDVEEIMKALEALSCEIPVKMDTEERRQALRKIVAECCGQSSWVALDMADHLVGFQLSKKYDDGFELPYGGVLPAYWKQGLFRRLLSKAKELKRPLHVTVSHANKSNMAAILAKEGFTKNLFYPNEEDYFIWKP